MRTILSGLSVCTLAGLAAPVCADDSSPSNQYTLEIERQPIVAALTEFSKQTGLQVGYMPRNEREERTIVAALSGQYTAESALEELLAPSGLAFERVNEKTIAVTAPRSTFQRLGFRLAHQSGGAKLGAWQEIKLAEAESPAGGGRTREKITESAGRKGAAPLEEVIVTAQKRAERLQDVPISISVLGGGDLDRLTVEGVSEALTMVPAIKMTQGYQGGGTQLSVRGVAASGPLFNGGGTVGYYLDSAPFGLVKTAIVPDSNVYDLERVEVLRGPQGTLYGAAALNGVVRVLTHDANLDEFELKGRTSLASTKEGGDSYRGDLVVNVPIAQGVWAARAVLGYADLGGWVDRLNAKDANDAELNSARLKVSGRPTEDLSIGISAWSSRSDYGAPPIGDADDRFNGTLDQTIATDYDVFGLKVGYDFPAFTVASMTSYIDFSNEGNLDVSQFGQGLFITNLYSKVLSQEVILDSTREGAWRWSAGGFYRDAEDRLFQTFSVDILPAPLDFSDLSESFAVFGELTRVFLDGKLELTGGLRYFEDEVTQRENVRNTGVPTEPLVRDTRKFDAISPRVVLAWHASDRSTLYGSYSEGFRSGFNQSPSVLTVAPSLAPVTEDTLVNYEVGAKGSVFDGGVTYDASVYYIDWQDVQQTFFLGPPLNLVAGLNGESASGFGVDLTLVARPADGLEFGASFSWNDLSLDDAVLSDGATIFDKGERLNYSSEYTVGASVEYGFPFGSLESRFAASANYSSKQTVHLMIGSGVEPLVLEGDGMVIGRASVSIGAPDRWSAAIFVDNFNNQRGFPVRIPPDDYSSRVRPRTVGLQLEFRF